MYYNLYIVVTTVLVIGSDFSKCFVRILDLTEAVLSLQPKEALKREQGLPSLGVNTKNDGASYLIQRFAEQNPHNLAIIETDGYR